MCDCFHLAFPNWHAASSGTAGRRLRAPEPGTEDDSVCDEPSQFTEGERPRPQGSSPVEEFPEKYTDSDKECEAEHDPRHKSGGGKKSKKSGLGSMFEKRSTPKMSKLKEAHSPESEVIVKTATDGCAEGLVYGGGGKEGIFIKGVVPESPASKSLKLKEGDQILSATVYFDNVPYEDAIQILEHAQAYRVKLCLKRKPDITETEAAKESDVIPEEELCAPEMREQGKIKRRGDARISWPKFPSFGKGRKTRFTRSHSSSEADEQRKLELSPTTSDTESPIKSQDTLKSKKRHKMKLSLLTKRSRIGSSEDTDNPTTGQTSSDVYQTASEMLSPECLESLSGETPQVYVTEELRLDQKDLTEPQAAQHKVDLICIDSTLKTADLTVALADQGSSSGIKSPTEKKQKKEKSELKVKILGKDKSHKKDAKAKASPKRLKTLGASIEIADKSVKEKSDLHTDLQRDQPPLDANSQLISSEASRAKPVTTQMEMNVPKVELDISDVTFMGKSHQKGEEPTKKDKEAKQKKETKTCPSFKLPKIGLGDIATEETIQTMSVNAECPTKMEKHKVEGPAVKDDPYDRLSKSSHSRTQLPKREDIEIPGMEDMSVRTKAKGIKEPKAVSAGRYEDIQTEDVQMSIDVDSVKEAVSKLPGFKLPKVDTSGMPIPEEITVIDANAQRISVKTPTKVADTRSKHEVHLIKFDTTAADLTSEELLIRTKVDYKKPEKVFNIKTKQSDYEMQSEIHKREDIIIPGKESGRKEFGFKLPKQIISGQEGGVILGERTILLQEVTTSKTETRKSKGQIGGVISDVKVPELDSIEYIDSVGGSPAEQGGGISLRGFGVHLDATKPRVDISFADIRGEDSEVGPEKLDKNINIDGAEIKVLQRREEMKYKIPNVGVSLRSVDVAIQEQRVEVGKPEVEIKPLQTEVELDGEGRKFKMPKLGIKVPKIKGPEFDLSSSKKDIEVKLPEAKAGVKLPEAPEVNLTLRSVDVSIPEQMVEVRKPELEIKPLQTEVELDGEGSKFKMPKFGIKMPQIKGPEFDLSSSKKDIEVKLPEAPEVNVTLGSADVSIPEQKVEVRKPEVEVKPLQTEVDLDGQGSKFKMPKFGITMPKIKGPEFDLSLSKKEADVTLPELNADGKLPDAPEIDASLGNVDVSISAQKMGIKKPEFQVRPLKIEGEPDGQGSKFKMPELGITMPQVKGPEIHFGLSKKDEDVTLQEAKAEVKVPEVKAKTPEIKVVPKRTEGSPLKFKMPSFKLPKFGIVTPNISVESHDIDKDVKIDGVDLKIPEEGSAINMSAPSIDIEGPSVDLKTTGTEQDGQGSKLKMPHLPKVKGPEFDLSFSKKDADKADVTLGSVDVSVPEQKVEVEKPELEIKRLQTEVELDGHGSKFKMPKFGIKMPKVKGPEFDLSWSKKDIDVTLPEAKAGVKLPEAPAVDVTLGTVDVSLPDQKVEVGKPELEIKPLQTEFELDEHGSKFKMPKFGITMPEVKGPEFDFSLSKKDVDVRLPEAKAEVSLPDVELKEPSTKVEVKVPEIKVAAKDTSGSPSRFKMPTFSFSKPKVKVPDIDLNLSKKDTDITSTVKLPEAPKVDVSLGKAEVLIPEAKVEVKKPEVQMKPLHADVEYEGQGGKFKMPKFGISMPKVKGPDIDFSLSKKDVDVKSPEATAEFKLPEAPEIDVSLCKAEVSIPDVKMEVEKPELEMKPLDTQVELDGHGSKFKMPKFGIKMPKVKGPEFDLSWSKKDIDVTLPEAKAGVKLPEAPAVDVTLGTVDVSLPDQKVEVGKPELEIKPLQTEVELDGHGSKFKMPKFGISMPKVKGPDIDFSFSKKDVDVKSPEATAEFKLPEAPEIDVSLCKAEVSIPDVKMEVEKPELEMKPLDTQVELDGHGSKFKMPKFGISMPKVKGPEFDFSSSKKDVDVRLSEAKAEVSLPDVELKEPSAKVDIKAPEIKVAAKDTSGSPSRFKMPTFSFSKPKVKVPDIDLNLSKKDTDITSTVKLPEAPKVDVSLGKAEVLIPEAKVEVKKPEVQMKPLHADVEYEGQGGKFKMPKFGISMPKVKGPDIDFSLSKKDVDVKSPEATAEFKLPEAPEIDVKLGKAEVSIPDVKMEVEKPELEMKPLDTQVEHGSKFKMPKFGIKMPKVKGPEFDLSWSKKDIDVTLPEAKAGVKLPEAPAVDVTLGTVDFSLPDQKVEVGKPELEIKPLQTEVELDGHGSKFKMPKFGITMPEVKGPEFDFSLSKKDVDVRLPEAKAEVSLPDVELKEPSTKVEVKVPEIKVAAKDTSGSPSRFKMPTFSFSKPKVKVPDIDLNLSKKDTDITSTVKLPEAPKVDVSLGKAEVLIPEAKVEVKKPEVQMKPLHADVEYEGQGGKFKMPKFGISMPKVKGPDIDLSFSKKDVNSPEATAEFKLPEAPEIDVKLGKAEVSIPDVKMEVEKPELEMKPLDTQVELDGHGSKFKMPKFGIKMPKVKGPEFDLSWSKKDIDVTLPEAKAGVKLPEAPAVDVTLGTVDVSLPDQKVEVGKPELEIKPLQTEFELDEHGSKFKMPKFGITMPEVKGPEFDFSLSKKDVDVRLPEAKAEVSLPDVELKEPSTKVEVKVPEIKVAAKDTSGSPSRFKMPTFSFSKPKVKVPDIDLNLSKKDTDITSTVKLPEAPKVDVSLGKAEVLIPEAKVEVKKPEVQMKPLHADVEYEGQGGKFKMPKFGISMPKVKGPDIDFSLSKKDVDVKSPEATAEFKLPEAPEIDVSLCKAEVSIPDVKMEVEKPELEMKPLDTQVELDGHGSKFKMPKFGIKMPKVKGPEFDLSWSKKDIDVTLPEAKAGVKLPEAPAVDVTLGTVDVSLPDQKVEVGKPELEIKPLQTEVELDGHGSKFKMPKFGISMPKVKGPEFDFSFSKKDVDVKSPEATAEFKLPEAPEIDVSLCKAEVSIPDVKMEVEKPELEMKPLDTQVELDGHGSKFKMPKFGIKMPKVKGPEFDFSSSKKDVDVRLPEAKAEVNLPDVELKEPSTKVEVKVPEIKVAAKDTSGSPSRFKMPTFGFSKPKVKVPDIDLNLSKKDTDITSTVKLPEAPKVDVSLGKAEVLIPEAKVEVKKPEVQMKPLHADVEYEGQGGKFKMPKFGISMPKVKGPDIDFSLSKKDVDVKSPEATAEFKLPEAPEIDVSLCKAEVSIPDVKMEVEKPELEMKPLDTQVELDGHGSKFKMPKFGIKMPKVKGPEFDLSWSKKDIDVTLPEAKAGVKLPEAPAVDVTLGTVDVSLPDQKVEVGKPELEIKPLQTEVELDGHGSKFKMPKFGITMPEVKGPEFDFSLSKKDVDVRLPEAKAEVSLPDVELKEPSTKVEVKGPEIKVAAKDTSGSPSRFKMPTFSFSKPKVKVPDIDLNLSKKDTDITSTVKLPEAPKVDVSLGKAEVLIPEAKVEVKKPEVQMKPLHADVEYEGQGGKVKMPKFGISMPKVKGPDIDFSLSKKDVDVKSPEATAEFKLPEAPEIDVKLGKPEVSIPDVKMEVEKPELEMKPLDTQVELDGHGSKFKMPKFGISMPKVKGPELDFSSSKKDVDVRLPEAKAEVSLPDVELKEPSTEVEVKGPEIEAQLGSMKGSPSKFKMPTFKFPKFGGATPNVSAEVPDTEHEITIDGAGISVPDVDVEVKGKVSLPEVEVKEPLGGVVIEQPEVEVDAKMKKPKFSLPRFSFSKPSVKAPEVDVSVQNVNVELPEGKVEVKGGEVDMKPPEVEAEIDRQGSQFKMPKFGISMPKVTGPEIDLSLSNKDVDVKIPEAKAEVKLPDVDLKAPSAEVEIKPPEIKVVTKDTDGSPSKFKMPTFKLPKFGIGAPSSTIEPDMDKDVKINGGDIEIPKEVVAVDMAAPSIDTEGPSIDLKTTATEHEGKGSKFKLPSLSFSVPQVKSPDVDLSLSKIGVDVTLPEAKADVQLPDAEVKEPSAKVEIKAPGIDVHASNVEGSPSKFKMPTFKLPKFGASATPVSVEVPDVDIKVAGEDLKLPEAKAEVKLPDVEIKEPVQGSISIDMAEGDAKVKKTSWTLPKFSFPKSNIKSPEAEVNLVTPKVDVSLPEVKAEVHLPDIDKESSSISVEGAANTDLDAKLKKPKFSLPKFSFSKQSSKDHEVDVSLPEVDVSLPEGNVEVTTSEVDLKPPEGDVKLDGQESKFKMPKFGISMPKVKGPDIDLSFSKKDVDVTQPKAEVEIPEGPKIDVDVKPSECEAEIDGQGAKFKMPKFGITMPKIKGPEIDLSLSKKDGDVTLPEAEVEVQLPDVKTKQPSGKVEIKAAEIKAGNVEGSPSKLKMPTFTLPKFGASTPKVSVQVPDVDKDIKIDAAKLEALKEGAAVTVSAPSIDAEGRSVNMKAKEGELEGSESKFKMPHIGITVPKVKGPEIDLSSSKKRSDVTSPEGKIEVTLPSAEVIGPEGAISLPDAPSVETEAKSKRPNWTFPKFSFSRTSGKAPDVDVNLDSPKADVASPELEAEVCLPHVRVKEPSGIISVEEPPAVELDGNVKKSKFSLPKFSFSKSSVAIPEVSAEPPRVDVSLPEGEVRVKQPEMEIKAPDHNVQGSKFKLPKLGIALQKAEGPEVDLNASQKDVEVSLPNVKAEVKLPGVEVKESSANVETDVGGSPLKFKMPTMKMPKFGGGTYDVTVEAPDADKAGKDGAKLQEDVPVEIKAPSVDIKTDSETPKTETDSVGHGSPSRFKLPSFKMPKMSFSKHKPEEEHGDDDGQDVQPETEEQTKSPKLTFKAIGEIFKNFDVEFDVSPTDKVEDHLEASKEVHETSEPSGEQLDAKEKETNAKDDTPKSPERTGWFKFPKFGLSSPSESAKTPEEDKHKDGTTPKTGDEEMSPTCSVQSSDAFADISSTMTSEHVGPSISSPTKVTVKYSDPDAALSLEDMHGNVITSTTRTEVISVEPHLPEKITILSSGVSSSSEDTLRLESGKIHVITSNIQATPDSQHAKLLTDVQVQSAGGPSLQSQGEEAASWTVEDSQGGKRTVYERHVVRETSSERSESKETIVITKQITRVFDSSEPISGDTATSIQRLRDSMHSEKMRFFDGAEK